MMDLRDLYQEVIIDHNKNPRNFRAIIEPSVEAKGYNPLCGDKLTVYMTLRAEKIKDVSFLGCGCAISLASASLMTDALQGKTTEEAHALFERFHRMLTSDDDVQAMTVDKLSVLAGVRAFPARVKCATLAWHTLEAALKKEQKTVSTE